MKKHFHTYKKLLALLPLFFLGFVSSTFGQREQFEFKLQYMEENGDSLWGVYVRPLTGFAAGNNDAVVGSGQVTILMRNNGLDSIHNIQSVSGDWNTNYDFVKGPCEAPDISYLFVGMRDGDGILLENGEETLLFTFQVPGECPDTLGLIHNVTDPFIPDNSGCGSGPGTNSAGNNPGQDLSVFNSSTGRIHNWLNNYAPQAYSCGDCDSDGIADGIEDTNGNGTFDPGVDSSGICDVCDPLGINFFSATLMGGDTLTMCGAAGEDSVALMVNLTGGWSPFDITVQAYDSLTMTADTIVFNDYEVGDRVYVSPMTTTTYRMINVTDTPPMNDQGVTFCTINPDSLFEHIEVTVEGPLFIDPGSGPFDFTACNLDTLGFGVSASNGGEGIIQYQWQLSNDNVSWSDVVDGTPYAFATTDSLVISNPLGLDGTYYRAKVFTETCDTLYSNSAQLGVDGPFIFDTQPVDQILCAEEDNVIFTTETSIGQGLFNRRWQVSQDGGASWADVVADAIYSFGAETVAVNSGNIQDTYHDTLYVTGPLSTMDQWQFRLAAVGQNTTACSEIYSDEATLTVEGVISIANANQPIDVQICSDTTACFGVTVDSESSSGTITYQWQELPRGGSTWTNISNDGTYSGARTDTLCVTNVLGRDEYRYRVLVQTEYCATITSDTAMLNVDGPISFEDNPDDITVCAEEDPNIFAVETWMGQGTLDRRWQISTDTGQTWTDLTISGIYSTGTAQTANPAPGFETAHFDTLYINTATSSMDHYQYRLAAIGQNSNNCEDVFSDEATLTVEGPITFAVQPVDVEICSDTVACFGVTVASESTSGLIEYQWYVRERSDAPGIWTALSNDGTYSGARSDTLCVTNPLGRDSFLYRVEVRTGLCQTITSDSALLRIDGPILFNDLADDVTVCALEDPNFFAYETYMGQGILDRRWQVSTDTGQTWTDVVIGGIYSVGIDSTDNPAPGFELAYQDTLFINTASFDMNKWQYRLVATGKNSNNCTDTNSREATLTVEGQLSFVIQPQNVALCADTAACFGVTIDNEANQGIVQYQWYKLDKGDDPNVDANWQVLSSSDGRYAGVRSDTLCVLFVAGQDSTQYRVGIRTTLCNEVLSNAATLNVDGPIEHFVDPQDETICAVEDDIYFTSLTFIGQGRMLTRWEVSTDNGANWAAVNLSDPIYSEGRRIAENPGGPVEDSLYYDTLFISSVVFGMNQWRYRNVAAGITGNGCDDVPSESAILTVEGLISVTDQPDPVAICSDTAACFGIATFNETGEGVIQYQWQTKAPNTNTWITLTASDGRYGGVRSDTLCVNNVSGLDSFLYRVLISTGTCANIASDSAMLSVAGPVDYVAEPQDVSICAAEDATFFNAETTIGQGGLTTRWEVSTDTGDTWTPVDDNLAVYTITSSKEANPLSTIDSTYYDTLHINAVATSNMDGYLYRLVSSGLNGTSCKDIPSEPGKLTLNGPMTVDYQPRDTVVCSGKPALFEVRIANESSGETIYQWQYSIDTTNPTGWYNLANGGTYNGTRDRVLSISDVARTTDGARDSMFFRVEYSTTFCDVQYSNPALLKVEGPFEFDTPEDSPHDTVVCAGEQVIFNANPNNYGFGDMIFSWDIFYNNNWVNIAQLTDTLATTISGETTTQLILDITEADRIYFDSTLFRIGVSSAECSEEIYSASALLRIDGALTFLQQPRDTTNCSDKGVIFFANVNNDGFGGRQSVQYRWQEYNHNTMTWRNVENEGVYNGASTDTLSIDITTALDSNQYRVIVWTNVCNPDTSDAAYLIEDGRVAFTDNPVDVIICSGENTSFDARVVNSTGQGDNVLNWQLSTNNGISWSNLDTSQVKDGAKLFTVAHTGPTNTGDSTATAMTTNLAVSDVEGMQGYRFRAAVTSEYCDTVFSQLAKLTVEGPFIATLSGDNDICANIGTTITADVTNLGAGLPMLTWQYKGPDSTDFADVPDNATWDIFHGEVTNGVGLKTLTIDSVLNETSRLNRPTTDTLWSLHNYQFRLHIVSDTCEVAVYSDTFTLRVVSDQIGRCDWDLDGLDNDTDLDDDNDRLTDSVEVYITTGPGSEPQDSIYQFDTDTDNDGVTDAEEDADDDTISNGEEVDDDNGNGIAEGIDTLGAFFGQPLGSDSGGSDNLYPQWDDPDTPGDIFNGDPLNPCDPILSPSCIGVVLDINVKLQGAMPELGLDTTNLVLMNDDLREDHLIPRTSPYDKFFVLDSLNSIVPAFVQVQRDSVLEEISLADSAAVFGPQGFYNDTDSNAVVDWVFVEIRDAAKLDSVVTTRAALLQRDGDVRDHRVLDARKVDEDGYSYLSFDSTLAGDYYVVVRHRNHLGVMTNRAGLYSPIVSRVDFTDKDFNALGIHSQRMNADSTEQYMWAGDVTSDRKVIYQGPGNDIDEMFFRVIADPGNDEFLDNYIVPGYYRTDYNLDGKSIFQGPDNDRQMLIFQSILQFPDNRVKFLANYVILEQLP
ncbi:MAG: hypothetical protein AAGJ18_00125 [Bacteroidota bacterium]